MERWPAEVIEKTGWLLWLSFGTGVAITGGIELLPLVRRGAQERGSRPLGRRTS
jgi:hypothetical protein